VLSNSDGPPDGTTHRPRRVSSTVWCPAQELQPGEEPLAPVKALRNLGDIVLAMPYVERQCEANGWDMPARLQLLLAHGICHLLGYDHNTDEEHAQVRRSGGDCTNPAALK